MKLLLLLTLFFTGINKPMHNDENWAQNPMVWYAQKHREEAVAHIKQIPFTKDGKTKQDRDLASEKFVNEFFRGKTDVETLAAFIIQNFKKQSWANVLGRISIILDANEEVWKDHQIDQIATHFKAAAKSNTSFIDKLNEKRNEIEYIAMDEYFKNYLANIFFEATIEEPSEYSKEELVGFLGIFQGFINKIRTENNRKPITLNWETLSQRFKDSINEE